ncbi:hypothetical protein [Halopenitus sp. POP-27]|uniref:hypothetical protein n=1 Tax=Halopenitus sp. POP-27 TaxID=2994425 RepID=UPI0024699F3A|nr:hypothetical protein [Halopenitus sp. POP-27]
MSDGRDGTDAEAADEERFTAVVQTAIAVAETNDGMDPTIIEDATRYAREERDTGRARYRSLLVDVAGIDPAVRSSGSITDDRPTDHSTTTPTERQRVAYARLRDHVDRRRGREADVDGLFE